MIKSGFAALILATLALSGCRVQTVDARIVTPVQPVAQRGLDIEGPWIMIGRGQEPRFMNVRRGRGGIQIENPQRTFFAQRVALGVFQDDRGRIYEFESDTSGRFENPNNSRRLRMVRPQR